MGIPIFKRELVQELYNSVEANIERYISGDFQGLFETPTLMRNIKTIDNTILHSEYFDKLITESGGINDANNSVQIFEALQGLTPYLAADERVWVALTHTSGLKFSAKRWIKKPDNRTQTINDVKLHFFARTGTRSYHRNNALASLWWWAHAANRLNDRDLFLSLKDFVGSPSFRADVIERPTTSRVDKVFRAIMCCYRAKLTESPTSTFFTRSGRYREWLKNINLSGGTVLYAAMNEDELVEFFKELLNQLESV